MEIKAKTFLITGGASGLGLATAQMIIKEMGNAVILDINSEVGKQEEQRLGDRALFCNVNVTDELSVLNAIDFTKKK